MRARCSSRRPATDRATRDTPAPAHEQPQRLRRVDAGPRRRPGCRRRLRRRSPTGHRSAVTRGCRPPRRTPHGRHRGHREVDATVAQPVVDRDDDGAGSGGNLPGDDVGLGHLQVAEHERSAVGPEEPATGASAGAVDAHGHLAVWARGSGVNGLDVRSDVAVDRGVERLPRRHLRTVGRRGTDRRQISDRRQPLRQHRHKLWVGHECIMPTPASPNAELCALRQVSARTAHGSTDGYIDPAGNVSEPHRSWILDEAKGGDGQPLSDTGYATEAGHQGGRPTRRGGNFVRVAVLSGHPDVSATMRDLVNNAVLELGYRPNALAAVSAVNGACPSVSPLPTSPIPSSRTSCVAPSGSCGPAVIRCC